MSGGTVKIAYVDCASGIAGDMFVAALLDAGLPFHTLKEALEALPLDHYEIRVEETQKQHLRALHFSVACDEDQPSRHYSDIVAMIEQTNWPTSVRQRAIAIFTKLGEAEANVHGTTLEAVHFHEVGAVDSIIDICSVAFGLHMLGIEKLYASPVNVGGGFVKTAHGTMPVPTPATLALAANIPIYSKHVEMEIATPTGMAILAALANGFGSMPMLKPEKTGCGAGTKDLPIPNMLRLTLGEAIGNITESTPNLQGALTDSVFEITADIDDMNPEWYGHLSETLLHAGALDVVMAPVYMKKSRPATRLTVLCQPCDFTIISRLILHETSTIGLRYQEMQRVMAHREIVLRDTEFGPVRFKQAYLGHELITSKPEYDDCTRIAREYGLTLKAVYARLASETAHSHPSLKRLSNPKAQVAS